MQCTSPITGYRAVEGGGISQSLSKGYADQPLTVRCGRCIGCRLERARVWAIRCVHEAALHEQNIFTTITYSDENLPYGETLVKKHMQDFLKRLRKRHPSNKIRVFYCGEYGDTTDRPHYHALLFNYEPSDKEQIAKKDGKIIYRSDKLDEIWGLGHINFGDVTFQSAAYVAGYVTKKITGPPAKEHYEWTDPETGEIIDRLPEFCHSSMKPGIGQGWIETWLQDVYSKDQLIIDGNPTRPPRYYDQQCEKLDPKLWEKVRLKRKKEAPQTIITTDYLDQKVLKKDVDPDEYYGRDRQMLARNQILTSRQRERNEQ